MGGTEELVDVSYRGLEVGRTLRLSEVGPRTAYLEHGSPLPVGAEISIVTDQGLSFEARVVRVHEQVAGVDRPPGMRVMVGSLEGAAREWWDARRDSEDPSLPLVERGETPAQDAPAPAAETTAEPADGDAASSSNGKRGEAVGQQTIPMSTSEIRAATGASDEEPDPDGSNGKNGSDGKRKRRRRGRKKR